MLHRGVNQPDVGSPQVTALLLAWGAGDESALEQLVPLVVDELRRLARRHMRRQQHGHVLQTTALVNEVYLRLAVNTRVPPKDHAHFMAVASRLMRHVLVDVARAERAAKRGGGIRAVTFDEAAMADEPAADLVALDDALRTLSAVDPRKSQVVELRFFGGLSVDETADALHVSPETVMRDWRLAKVWLMREITRGRRG
jgi:RNA polymerase sigma factor (TIGR02999 family)